MAVFDDEGRPTLVLVPGDREARLPAGWRLFEDADFDAHPIAGQGATSARWATGARVRVVADHRRGPARAAGSPGPTGWTTT